MDSMHLQLLGGFGISSGSGPVRLGRKARALLACAAGAGCEGVNRAKVAALLWPDSDEEAARSSLRQSIHQLRVALHDPALLDGAGDFVVLCATRWDVDVWRFETLAAADGVSLQLEAAALYRGELVAGLEIGPEWDTWVAAERERLRNIAQSLLSRLADAALDAAQSDIAISFARRLIEDDPLHEGSWRALMRLLDRAGLRAKALAAWEDCSRVLHAELGVAPCAQTRSVYERLLGGATPEPMLPRVPRAAPQVRAVSDNAQDQILRGMHYFFMGSAQDNLRARQAFQAATEAAPNSADAHCLVGWTYFVDFFGGWNAGAEASYAIARRQCDEALARFPDHPSPHSLDGKLLLWKRQFKPAVAALELALALAPASPYMHSGLADARMCLGEHDEALRLVARALELEPNDKGIFRTLEAFARFYMGDLEAALAAFHSAVTRHPRYCYAYSGMAAAHAELGDLPRAREAAEMARDNNSRYSIDFALHALPVQSARERERVARAWQAAGMPAHEGWSQAATSPA